MKRKRNMAFFCGVLLVSVLLFGYGFMGGEWPLSIQGKSEREKVQRDVQISRFLTYTHSMDTRYAQEFSVDYYADGYALLTLSGTDRFLVIPEDGTVPEDLSKDVVPLRQPVRQIYLVASAVMDMFVALDGLDSLRFCGLPPDGWYIPEVRDAMGRGDLLYAGKYAAPDYERILSEGCGLAIENTMIYHAPEVKEKLEQFSIPVLVDYSSHEKEPLGRTEWIRLYGALLGKEQEAEAAFSAQAAKLEALEGEERTGKTVAFFYITADGRVSVRKSSDYLAKMIELAGGNYIFSELGDKDTASSTITLQMEEFYAAARDADYLIYNSTIDGELASVDQLAAKHELLRDFKAVGEGKVFCTAKNLYQSSMSLGSITFDIHKMLAGEEEDMTFLYKLQD